MSNFLCHFWHYNSIPLQILYPLQFHERLFLCSFSVQTIYTLPDRSPTKWTFLRLSNAWVKICQIPYANFETTSRFLSKFCIPLEFQERLFLCSFLIKTIYTLLNRSQLKSTFLRHTSAQVTICQISFVNFETASPFLSKFFIRLQFNEIFRTFLAQAIYVLCSKGAH